MSNYVRVIPRLDIKGPNLVKGIHLEGLRVMGNPHDFAKYYYETGADELLLMDVVASLYGRNSIHEIITKTAKSIFIPITVGGGIRSLDDIKQVLRAGADKVCLNTAAIGNPNIIKEASRHFGSSTVVVAIEAIKHPDGKYYAYTDNGREYTGKEIFSWATEVQELGAGEIIITSVDKEGTGKGFDIELISDMVKSINIPVIAHGGPGNIDDISTMVNESKVDAFAVASMLHYNFIENNPTEVSGDSEGNVEFLKKNKSFSAFQTTTISEIKKNLQSNDILCRI